MGRWATGPVRLTLLLTSVLAASAPGPVRADAEDGVLSGTLTLASDFVFRGVSQTMGRAAAQGSVDLQFDNGLYAYAWTSNIDFRPDAEPDDGARAEFDLAIGYAAPLSDRWSLDVTLVRYLFPGTYAGVDYDYNELIATLSLDDFVSAAAAFAKNVDGTGRDARFFELGAAFELPHELALEVAYGYYDLSKAYGSAYAYSRAAISRDLGSTALTLSYNDTYDGDDEAYYDQSTGSRIILSLDIHL